MISGEYFDNHEMYENAIDDYSQAIELDSSKSEYYTKRARAYMFLHKFDNALIDSSRAVALEESAASYVFRALAYYYMEEYEKSIDDYTVAVFCTGAVKAKMDNYKIIKCREDNNICIIRDKYLNYGLSDKDLNIILPAEYMSIQFCKDGDANIELVKKDKNGCPKYGRADKSGKIILEPKN